MDEENFGYSLPPTQLTNEDILPSLHAKINTSLRNSCISLLGIVANYYASEKCHERFPDSGFIIYSGALLVDLIGLCICSHSLYASWKAHKQISKLEQKIGSENDSNLF